MRDQELVIALSAGKPSAYRQLAEKYQEPVVRTCYSFVHDRQDAEDLSQEVFLEVFRSVARFQGKSGIGTWIYRIAVNKSLNFMRDKKKRSIFERLEDFFGKGSNAAEIQASLTETNSEAEEVESKRRDALYRSVDALPESQRAVFVLHKYDELSHREIAEILNLSLSSVESLMHRAKKNLQKNILAFYQNNK